VTGRSTAASRHVPRTRSIDGRDRAQHTISAASGAREGATGSFMRWRHGDALNSVDDAVDKSNASAGSAAATGSVPVSALIFSAESRTIRSASRHTRSASSPVSGPPARDAPVSGAACRPAACARRSSAPIRRAASASTSPVRACRHRTGQARRPTRHWLAARRQLPRPQRRPVTGRKRVSAAPRHKAPTLTTIRKCDH
jgi:hypothetical protein